MERWAEFRREHFVRGVAIKELVRRTGLSRNTIRAALRSADAAGVSACRSGRRSSIRSRMRSIGCCGTTRSCPGVRVRELIEPLGFDGGKTIVDDYLREVRPMFLRLADASADGVSAGRDLPVGSVGDHRRRCRSVTARSAGRGSWSRAWGTRAPARAR